MADRVFKVPPYEINTLELFKDLITFLKMETTYNSPIGNKAHLARIRSTVIIHAKNQGFQNDYIEIAKKHVFFIDCDHPGFTYWLALKISIAENYEIPLMLDSFLKRSKMSSNQFVNRIEYELLKEIITHQIFHNIDDKKLVVSNWIREQRDKIDPNEPDKKIVRGPVKRAEYNRENLPYIEQFVDEFAGSIEDDDNEHKDDRIECDTLTPEEIQHYFKKLNILNQKGEVILESNDIEHLLRSNFKGFEFAERKILEPRVSKSTLMKFIYEFYRNVDGSSYDGRQMAYCKFLKNNFFRFKDDKLKDISKKISSANPRYYPFKS